MLLIFYAVGGFCTGVLLTVLVILVLLRREEQRAFRGFWGAP